MGKWVKGKKDNDELPYPFPLFPSYPFPPSSFIPAFKNFGTNSGKWCLKLRTVREATVAFLQSFPAPEVRE
ncbi:MAG: hypothetical protein AUG51_07590 [Acidobacteria bacterium 13_1_20CM_3_53_8]|nr:MAG: hypothetical protein AUG51_07590 [Acidobacteria bacterium 13_1_20CM_3_53_8]